MRPKEAYSHYEMVRIVSARALQISQGAPVLVAIPRDMFKPIEIAKLEWESEMIPIDTRPRAS